MPRELVYSRHAEQRMRQRGVTRADVQWALEREIDRTPGDSGTVWIHGQPAGNRILKVLVPSNDHSFVITVAWRD